MDNDVTIIHWNMCKRYKLPASDNWWNHKIEKVVENEEVQVLWDFRIETEKHLPHQE